MAKYYSDVIVIGGGVIGMSCAWRLAGAGLTVTLLERETCGAGASAASLGALIPSSPTHRRPKQCLHRASLWQWPGFAAELTERSGIDVGYRRCGSLDLLHSEQRRQQATIEVEAANAEWPEYGDRPVMEILEEAEARALEPAVSFDEPGARLCRVSAQVNVDRLLLALRTACVHAGVIVREDCGATGIEVTDSRVTAVQVENETVGAAAVLVAAGVWTPSVAAPVRCCAPIVPVKGQAMALRVAEPPCRHIIKRRTSYVIPEDDDEALIGSTTEREAGFDQRATARGVAELAEGALALIPSLRDGQVVRSWAGLRPDSETHNPVMGPAPHTDGLYVCAGHFKTGLSWAPMAARIMTDWLTDKTVDATARAFVPTPVASGQ